MKFKFKRSHFVKTRDELFLQFCKNKAILHIGATDAPYTAQKLADGLLLHQKLQTVSKTLLGIDIEQQAIDYLKTKGFDNIISFDLNKLEDIHFVPDVVVFGETIEHIMNVEQCLSTIKKVMTPQTILLISTPNALYCNDFINGLLYKESLHDDHKLNFTYGAMAHLLVANGFVIENSYFSFLNRRKRSFVKKVLYLFSYLFVATSETLIFVVKKQS